jgi:hypothetical protein
VKITFEKQSHFHGRKLVRLAFVDGKRVRCIVDWGTLDKMPGFERRSRYELEQEEGKIGKILGPYFRKKIKERASDLHIFGRYRDILLTLEDMSDV